MTELEDRLRSTLHAHENDIDPSAVRRDYSRLSANGSVGRRFVPAVVAAAVTGIVLLVGYLAWPAGGTDLIGPAGSSGAYVKGGPPPHIQDGPASTPTAGTYGVAVTIRIVFDEDRVITNGTLVMADGTPDKELEFYVEDGTDSDGSYVVPLEVAAGVKVGVSASLLPACGVDVTQAPAFDIRSTSAADGGSGETIDGVAAAELPAWRQAVQDWCASGVQAHLSGYTTTLDGGVTQTLTVYNPGPGAVTIVCTAQRDGDSGWDAAQVTVAGGAVGELTTHGVRVSPESDAPLTVNGEPLEVLH